MSRRLLVLLALLLLALAGLVALQFQPGQGLAALPLQDYVEYYAAGRLLWQGENPYDEKRVGELERQAGRTEAPILMYNPPYTLPLVVPFGALPVRVGHLAWLLLHFLLLAITSDALYRFYGGPDQYRILAVVFGLLFGPSLSAIIVGQISPLLLLGAWAFLLLVGQKRDLEAGMVTVLLAIKPHLCYLFWIAVLLWVIQTGRWRVIAGGVLAGLLLTGVAMVFRPMVVNDFLRCPPPKQYESPVWGTLIRQALGGIHQTSFSWQYLPMVPGLIWLAAAWPWLRHRDWPDLLPPLLLVSLLTAPYGAWLFDLVLLLVPLLHLMAVVLRLGRLVWFAATAYALLCTVIVVMVIVGGRYLAFIWVTPAVMALYFGVFAALRNTNQPQAAGPSAG